MKSLVIQALPPVENEKVTILHEVRSILHTLSGATLLSPEKTLQKIQESYPKANIVKHPRQNKIDDSYIISLPCQTGAISLKIHKDIFKNCRRVYKNKILLRDLIRNHIIPSVLETYTVYGIRVVVYEWETGEEPLDVLKRTQIEFREKIERLLAELLDSLGRKGCSIYPIYPKSNDFLYTQGGTLVLLDANGIAKGNTTKPSIKQAKEIVAVWLSQI